MAELMSPCSITLQVLEHTSTCEVNPTAHGDKLYKIIGMKCEVVECSEWIEESLFGVACVPSISNNLSDDESEALIGQITYAAEHELFISIAIRPKQFSEIEVVFRSARGLTLRIEFEAPPSFTVSVVGHWPIKGFSLTDEKDFSAGKKPNRIFDRLRR